MMSSSTRNESNVSELIWGREKAYGIVRDSDGDS